MKDPNKFTQGDLARHWGCKPSFITKLKQQGMPVDSIESAEKWRQERQQQIGAKTKPPADGKVPEEKEEHEEDDPAEVELPGREGISLVGLLRALADARNIAQKAKRMVNWAQKYGKDALIPQRIANHTNAVKEYGRLEEWVRKERERREELMTMDQHKIQMNKLWIPLVTQVRRMPRLLAMKVNPADDAHAEKLISEAAEDVIAEGLRSMAEPPDAEYHFKVWLYYTLANDKEGGKNAIERLHEAIRHIEEARDRDASDNQNLPGSPGNSSEPL